MELATITPPPPANEESTRAFWQAVVRLMDEKRRTETLPAPMSYPAAERRCLVSLVSELYRWTGGAAAAVAKYDLDLVWLQWQAINGRAEHQRGDGALSFPMYDRGIEGVVLKGLFGIPSHMTSNLFAPIEVVQIPSRSKVLHSHTRRPLLDSGDGMDW